MKLYFSPGACSLSPHIVLHEAGYDFTTERVDLKAHRTERGASLESVHAKNYVPILELDNGELLTEGTAIVQFLADRKSEANLLPAPGSIERTRVQEWLNFTTSELHKAFVPLFNRDTSSKDWQEASQKKLESRFTWANAQLEGKTYLVGERFTVADAYLFTVANWCNYVGIDLAQWPALQAYLARIASRPAVQRAMQAEGLTAKAA